MPISRISVQLISWAIVLPPIRVYFDSRPSYRRPRRHLLFGGADLCMVAGLISAVDSGSLLSGTPTLQRVVRYAPQSKGHELAVVGRLCNTNEEATGTRIGTRTVEPSVVEQSR